MSKTNRKPFIKWVGGKGRLLPELLESIKKLDGSFESYYEPFVGGGALFFELSRLGIINGLKQHIQLSDANQELINTYIIVRDYPNELLEKLSLFKKNHSKEFYYEIRAWDRDESFQERNLIDRAARFIYMNKTGFNGLYRVNKKNQNNVPMGRYKNPDICNREVILSASQSLKGVTIKHCGYLDAIQDSKQGDLIYLDPPYYTKDSNSKFTSYTKSQFLEKEHLELIQEIKVLDKAGVRLIQSNSYSEFIKEKYLKFNINEVSTRRSISQNSDSRGEVLELLITNF